MPEITTIVVNKKKIIIAVAVLVLIIGNIAFAIGYFSEKQKLREMELRLNATQLNGKIIDFTTLFIKKVLKAEEEVSFNDRLKLETDVRDLQDPVVLDLWEKFLAVTTQDQAQEAVKNLLEALVSKIVY